NKCLQPGIPSSFPGGSIQGAHGVQFRFFSLFGPPGVGMRVEKQEIEKLAKLARLDVPAEDIEKLQGSLSSLVEYLDTLKQIHLEDVEPMTAVDDSPRPLRPDVEQPMLPKDKALANAPEVNLEHFSIPKVIGG